MSDKLKYYLNAGAIIGLVFGLVQAFAIFVLAIGIFYAVKRYRDNYSEGFISFQDCFKQGVVLSFLIGIVGSFFNYMRFIFYPEEQYESFAQAFELMQKMGYSQQNLTQFKDLLNPTMFAISSLISTVLLGFLLSLIFAFILKKNKPEIEL